MQTEAERHVFTPGSVDRTPAGMGRESVIVRSMFPSQGWESGIRQYSKSHQHPLNRLAHTFGIPMVMASIPMMPAGLLWRPLLWCGICLFLMGWVLQFLGHAIEGKPPEFLSDWRFLLVGPRWWVAKVRGKL
jgi:uncharacterized membrane protein YGL010W